MFVVEEAIHWMKPEKMDKLLCVKFLHNNILITEINHFHIWYEIMQKYENTFFFFL